MVTAIKGISTLLFNALLVFFFLAIVCSCGGGNGKDRGSEAAPAPPVITSTNAARQIAISWSDVPGAARYNLYWSTNSSVSPGAATKISDVHSPFIHDSLTQGGSYYYCITSVSVNGVESTASNKISVYLATNQNPSAALTLPLSAYFGETVALDASASSDRDGTILKYSFDFGDGTTVQQSSPFVSHVFASRGTFPVVLTITDDAGASSSITNEITVGLVSQNSVDVSGPLGLSQYYVLAVDPSDAIAVTWNCLGALYFASSADGGATFGLKKKWFYPGYSNEQPAVAASQGDFFFVWTMFGSTGAEIAFTRTIDRNSIILDPVTVSSIDGMNSFAPTIAVEGSKVFIAWSDANPRGPDPRPQGVFYSLSTDGGRTFSAPANLGPGGGQHAVISNGKIHLCWLDAFGKKLMFATSDDGITFTPPQIVSAIAPTNPDGIFIQDLLADQDGRVYLAWGEGGYGLKIKLASSVDRGNSFSSPTLVVDPSQMVRASSFNVRPDGVLTVVWDSSPLFPYTSKKYLIFSRDHGLTFSSPMKIASLSDEDTLPQIVSRPNNVLGSVWARPVAAAGTGKFQDIFYGNIVLR